MLSVMLVVKGSLSRTKIQVHTTEQKYLNNICVYTVCAYSQHTYIVQIFILCVYYKLSCIVSA